MVQILAQSFKVKRFLKMLCEDINANEDFFVPYPMIQRCSQGTSSTFSVSIRYLCDDSRVSIQRYGGVSV